MNTKTLLIILLICIALYFVLREVFCWYWKVNKRIELMEEQNQLLKIIAGVESPTTETAKDYNESDNDLGEVPSLVIPKVSWIKNGKVKFSDGTKTDIVKETDGYFFVSKRGRHYYKTEESAIRASYIYKMTKVISKKDIVK